MNIEEAKKLSLPDILSRLGHEPVDIKNGGQEYWYRSPFRQEKEPSFHTSFLGGKWIWNDFADEGGTVIDFALRYEGYSKVSDALRFLRELYGGNYHPKRNPSLFSFQPPAEPKAKQLEFLSAGELKNPAILQYLTQQRKIAESLARVYLKEVHYLNKKNEKEYFAFGMKNRSGGYEIRVASDEYPFKSALIKRDISLIPGFKSGHGIVHIFEGMTDFLSLLTMMQTDRLAGDTIVMHSLSSLKQTVACIREQGYDSIHTYLDNNRSGQKASQQLQEALSSQVKNESGMFMPYEDLNDFLQA
jgi:hypothetical protein